MVAPLVIVGLAGLAGIIGALLTYRGAHKAHISWDEFWHGEHDGGGDDGDGPGWSAGLGGIGIGIVLIGGLLLLGGRK